MINELDGLGNMIQLVADTIETAWEVYTNPALSEGHEFRINLNSRNISAPPDPQKLSVRVEGVTDWNGGSSSPHLQISPRGGITGAADESWGPHGYAGGTAPHELGHVMNKSYSYYFNSGGTGLLWINEGIVDVYRALLDPYYPATPGRYKPLIGHLDLSRQSLRRNLIHVCQTD